MPLDYLSELENNSIFIIREAYRRLKNVAMLWSMGKDSTALLWLIRKAFLGDVPFPVIHIDTGYKFKEIYVFRDKFSKKWGLNLIIARNLPAINSGVSPWNSKFDCCNRLKTDALKMAIAQYNLCGIYLAIRRDEHGIRAKERAFSSRTSDFLWNYLDQPPEIWSQYNTRLREKEHIRIHPMLAWREIDIWQYIRREKLPVVPLYFARGKKRYRSIGCSCCCSPVDSRACDINSIINELAKSEISERSGRAQDKESAYTMQKLRALGYM